MRSNELSFARRGALQKLAARRQGARPSVLTGLLVGLDPDDDSRVVVSFDGSEVSVLAGPQKLVPGTVVAVEVDSSNSPVRVTGPVTTRPEGLDADMPAPAPVTPMPELASFSPEDQAKVDQAVADIGEAQADLAHALPIVDLLEDLGAGNGETALAEGLAQYISLPLDQITIVDNRGADGQVIANLYDAIIVDGLLLAEEVITGSMLATGAVTASALNVVHVDPDTGYGWRADPEGLTFLDQDGNASIVLRTDMENRISIAQDGIVVASISPDGVLVGQTVTANQSLLYRGVEMDAILAERARGPVVFTKMTGAAIVGTAPARLVMATIETPTDRRAYKLTFGFHRQSASRMQITFRQSIGNTVSNANSIQNYWYVARTADATADYVEIAHIIPDSVNAWGAGNTVTFGFFAESLTSGQTVTFDPAHGVTMLVEDIGPALEVRDSVPYVPASGGGGGQGSDAGTTKKTYNSAWNATGHRTYSYTTLTSTRASSSLVQGYMGGANSRGHWFFPDAIRTALTGATVNSATLTITNQGTGEGRATVVLKVHGYATAPSTFGTATAWTTITVTSGQEISIPIPSWILNGIRDGSIKGFSLDHGGSTSRAFYAFFSPQATVRANYTK